MKPKIIEQVLQAIGSKMATDQGRAGWVIAHCPLGPWKHDGEDKNPSFGVKIEPGDPLCNCFSCGAGGPLSSIVGDVQFENNLAKGPDAYDFLKAYQLIDEAVGAMEIELDDPDVEELYLLNAKKKNDVVYPDWWLEAFPRIKDEPLDWAVKYLQERRVPPELVTHMDLRIDPIQRRICQPVYDFDGKLRGLHGRAVFESKLRYRMYTFEHQTNPLIWLGEDWVDVDQPIVIVEGMFDVYQTMKVYPNVVSPLYANPSVEKLKRMGEASHWITLLDRGKGGDAGRTKIDQFAKADRIVQHLELPKEFADPGVTPAGELHTLLSTVLDL